jgi:hypothetical protein
MRKGLISVESLFPDLKWDMVKIHVAQRAGRTEPIEVFTTDWEHWQNGWNGSWHVNNCWNRDYIFSMIELPREPNRWLFGGIFEVLSCKKGRNKKGKEGRVYKVRLHPIGEALIGRLVIHWVKTARAKGRKPEGMLVDMTVAELLPKPYVGEDFPGHAKINHNYAVLERLWKESKPDWRAALENCHGVYLITDTRTGRRYVGSAYGDDGIWSRWGKYFKFGGHGGNTLIKKLLKPKSKGVKYARENFRLSLLEQASSRDSEQQVIAREGYWKDVLMTRGPFGLNDN